MTPPFSELEAKTLQDLERAVEKGYWVDVGTLNVLRAHVAAETAKQIELIQRLRDTIEAMNSLHQKCLESDCSCYNNPDGICLHCNRSIRLSEKAEKALEIADSVLDKYLW